VRFDKIIFAGSIVARDFDWARVLRAGQVNLVRNDFGALDPWPRMARWLVRDSGSSGTDGFVSRHPLLVEQKFPRHGHSDYFHQAHFTQSWIPTLMRVVVSPGDRRRLTDLLDVTCQTAARRLGVDRGLVRANLFVPDESGRLSIPDGLTHNMTDRTERSLVITRGVGATGIAFVERKQTIAIMQTDWGTHTLPGTELAKIDKRLKWIISTPIPDPDVAGAILGVFNIDGLLESKERDDLGPLLPDLLVVADSLAVTFKQLA
jgi:hypothetical protein